MESAPKSCVLCNRTSRSLLIRIGEWTVYRCAGCGLGVLDPRPDRSELEALYRESYFRGHYDAGLHPGSPEMRKRLSQEEHRLRFFGRYRRSGLVLDIGCGRGYFLLACRMRGYDVVGLDVSGDAAAYVGDTLGIPVKTGTAGEATFGEESVDVVTMWHSLEHMTDPGECLRRAWTWLKPGGILVVDVPNYEGTDARKKGRGWEDWDLPYHLYHFSPGTLKEMLSRAGFRVAASKHYHSEYVKTRLKSVPIVGLAARPIAKLFSGTGYAVVARKAKRTEPGGAHAERR